MRLARRMATPDKLPESNVSITAFLLVMFLGFMAAIMKFLFQAGDKPIYWRLLLVTGGMGSLVSLAVYSLIGIRGMDGTESLARMYVIILVGVLTGMFWSECLQRLHILIKWIPTKKGEPEP